MKPLQIFIERTSARLKALSLCVGITLGTSVHSLAEETITPTPPPTGSVEATAGAPLAPDLGSVLRSVTQNNAQIEEARQDIEVARGQLRQAFAAAWPRGEAMIIGAPMPQVRGDIHSSTTDFSKWGTFISAAGQVVQPIYTFGQISNYQRAAEHQVTAKTELADVKRDEVLLTAKEFYYSYLMAGDLLALIDDLVSFLDEAVTTAEEQRKEEKSSSVKPHDLYRLKTALDDLKQKRLMAVQGKAIAEKAVAWIAGGTIGGVEKGELRKEVFQKRSLDEYLSLARGARPETRALKAGIVAREALADAKQAQSYPTIFLGGFAQAMWSNAADKQPSFFLNDPFNRVQGGGGLGVRVSLEFARHAAEAAEQRAEAMKLRATEKWAVPGIELQVKRAYGEVEQAVEGLEIATRRRDTAKKWFVSNAMGWSIGVTSPKDLLESLEGNGLARRNYVETLFSYNMALAKLTQAVGKEVTDLKY